MIEPTGDRALADAAAVVSDTVCGRYSGISDQDIGAVGGGPIGVITVAQKEEFRRALREGRESQRRSQRELATALGVSHTAVSQWEVGRSLPSPAKVPDLERALELEPGALSRLLGYLPIASGDDKASLDVIEAIRRDTRLGEQGQELLITMYRQLLRQREQPAITR
jgi:transcriptional regulator with XRE-family HTH domain